MEKYSLLMNKTVSLAEIHLVQSAGLLSPDYGSGEMRYLIRHILESCNIFAYFPKACNEELLIFHFHYYQKRRVTIKTPLAVLVPEQRGRSAYLGHSGNDPTAKLSRELLKRRVLVPVPNPCPFLSLSLPIFCPPHRTHRTTCI